MIATLKLIKGNKYKITYPNGNSEILTYAGVQGGSNFICDLCGKDRWKLHFFDCGEGDNRKYSVKYGTECIKHITLTEIG